MGMIYVISSYREDYQTVFIIINYVLCVTYWWIALDFDYQIIVCQILIDYQI